jgi:hypothetical protein
VLNTSITAVGSPVNPVGMNALPRSRELRETGVPASGLRHIDNLPREMGMVRRHPTGHENQLGFPATQFRLSLKQVVGIVIFVGASWILGQQNPAP